LVSPYATCELLGVLVVHPIVAPDGVIELAETPEFTGPTGLPTITETLLVAVLPAASLAMALNVCSPFTAAVLAHGTE
jgi:hypothetical protein